MVDVGVKNSKDICDHAVFVDSYTSNKITGIVAGEPALNLTLFIDGDLIFINTKVSDYLAELHKSSDDSFVEMEGIRVRDMLDL